MRFEWISGSCSGAEVSVCPNGQTVSPSAGYLKTPSNQGLAPGLATPSSSFLHSGDAPWAGAKAPRIFGSCTHLPCPTLKCRSVACPAICREPAANPVHAVCQVQPSRLILLPLRGRSRDKPAPTGTASTLRFCFWSGANALRIFGSCIHLPNFTSESRSVACPAICRDPAANPVHAVCQAESSRLILLPLRGRSRARWNATPVAPTASGQNQNQSSKLLLLLLSLLIFIPRTFRHRKTRLGCRPNADDAQWAERQGCRESAVRTWMSVRRGPTERRRSAGTRGTRAKPGANGFGYFSRKKSDPL